MVTFMKAAFVGAAMLVPIADGRKYPLDVYTAEGPDEIDVKSWVKYAVVISTVMSASEYP
jgi:hypothetical protein